MLFKKRSSYFFIVIFILVIIINSVTVFASSPKGLPFLCPVGVNEPNINSYWTNVAMHKYPSDQLDCVYENVRISCDDAQSKLISDKTTEDRLKVEEEMKDCESYFQSIKSYYEEDTSDYCNPSRIDYFIAGHLDEDGETEGWNSNIAPSWTYDLYTGSLNGIKQYSHNSLNNFYWEDANCPYYDAVDDYSIKEFDEIRDATYEFYCNNIKLDNKEAYNSCWQNNKYRSCQNTCDKDFDYWNVPSYETEKLELMSAEYSDCVSLCGEDFDYFVNCVYDSFVQDYCWIPNYLISRNILVRDSSKYYIISPDVSKEGEFFTRAYENNFYQYSIHVETINLEFQCPESSEYDEINNICFSIDKGKSSIKFSLGSEEFDAAKDNFITGTATHICEGDCPGDNVYLQAKAVNGESVSFKIIFDGETFLTKSYPSVDFKIYLDNYNALSDGIDTIKIKVYQDVREPQYFSFIPQEINDFEIIPSDWSIRQDDKISIHVSVDGPNDISYTYVLSSALDATFYYDGKDYPIATFITKKGNSLDFDYKPPMISRIVNARDFYLSELGELSVGLASSSIKGLSSMLLGKALSTKLSGVNIKGYEVTSNVVDKGLANADGLMTFGMDGFLPATFSLMSNFGNVGAAVGTVGDMSYQTYQAYTRADERFKAFAITTEHEYPVPIKVSVKGEGFSPIEKAIKITVTAPEAIVK